MASSSTSSDVYMALPHKRFYAQNPGWKDIKPDHRIDDSVMITATGQRLIEQSPGVYCSPELLEYSRQRAESSKTRKKPTRDDDSDEYMPSGTDDDTEFSDTAVSEESLSRSHSKKRSSQSSKTSLSTPSIGLTNPPKKRSRGKNVVTKQGSQRGPLDPPGIIDSSRRKNPWRADSEDKTPVLPPSSPVSRRPSQTPAVICAYDSHAPGGEHQAGVGTAVDPIIIDN